MRKPAAIVAAAAVLGALVALADPANAACGATGDICTATPATVVTFDVGLGTLTITAAATAPTAPSAVIGSSGAVATIPLGTTTVKDTRITATSWSMSATASNFTTTPTGTISHTNALFSVQATPTAPTGMVLPTYSTVPSTTPQAVDTNGTRVLMTTSVGATNNGATFTPVLTVNVPAGSVAGTYTGTVTQSVA